MAKQARYQGDKLAIFNAAKAAAESKHKLAVSDEMALGFQTTPRWYREDGVVARGTDENFQDIPDNSIRMSLVVRMLPDADKWIVQVEPLMHRKLIGSPAPQPLRPNDPSLPGWTRGQVDNLHFEIYQALKPYQVMTAGGVVPAAPSPSPVTPAPPVDPAGTTEPAPAPAPGPTPAT